MKLILCLLFLEFIYVQSAYDYYSKLNKYGEVELTWSKHRNYNGLYLYLDLNDFKDEKSLYFKFTIYNGYFKDSYMRYDMSDTLINTQDWNLGKTVSYYSSTYGSSYYSSYYDYYTYRFVIDKPSNYRYLYIGHPSVNYYYTYSTSYLEIENVSGFGLSVAVIVIIVIAVIAIVAASIVVYFCRRARRASYIAPPVAEYQPPVAAATAYPPPTYY